jgi:NAD(P)-dependent dehydrogenase (short-subunit alcohol dehydrogenase family)
MACCTRFGHKVQMVQRAVIVGASGGIGAALARELHQRFPQAEIWGLARDPGRADLPFARVLAADLEHEDSLAAAAAQIAAPLDLVLVASGVLGAPGGNGPERRLAALDPAQAARVMAINAVGPALVAKHFLPLFARDRRGVFAALSARVGSISDNQLGGWYSYRASKAALNMLVRNLSIELARTHPQAVAVTLHPGTVATQLSAPFQRNVAAEQLFTAEQSAAYLLDVIEQLNPADSGQCFAWDGLAIPF